MYIESKIKAIDFSRLSRIKLSCT